MLADLFARALEAPLGARPRERRAPHAEARGAIVVLGAVLARDGRLSAALVERVAAAAALFHAGGARTVIATGGITRFRGRSEGDAIAAALVELGVPAPAIVVESAARTTADNARLTAAELRRLGERTAWIVTQPFHARRAVYLFARAGVDARAWHIADSLEYRDRPRALRWLVREYGAWVKLALRRGRL